MADNSDLAVRLRRNDGSEEFRLKADNVETSVENGLVMDSVISAASREILGGKLVLDLQRYTISIDIQGMTPDDYPNSGVYDGSSPATPDDDDYGFRDELMRASKEWGFDVDNGFDTLVYDGREIDGVITAFDPSESMDESPGRTYSATLEWTFLDAYVS
jgi:hypothetical protein